MNAAEPSGAAIVPEFLDSNVLIYAYDQSDPRKMEIARRLVRRALSSEIVASTQVLAEFASILLHKASPAAAPAEVLAILDALSLLKLVPLDGGAVRRAVEAHMLYGIHFYDAMIVAAAERGGCRRIWTEDLNSGQRYFDIEAANPFAVSLPE